MQCTGCGYPDSSVVYTRSDEARNLTQRRRECLRCGLRFTTHEKIRTPDYVKRPLKDAHK